MTPEEWSNLFDAWGNGGRVSITFHSARGPREWEIQRDASHYFDKLYCQEIGIRFP